MNKILALFLLLIVSVGTVGAVEGPKKFKGIGPPGQIFSSRWGDTYVDYFNQKSYHCFSLSYCNGTGTGHWKEIGSGGSGGATVWGAIPVSPALSNQTDLSNALSLKANVADICSIGSFNQIAGVNSSGSACEFKTLEAGSNVTITHFPNRVIFSSTGGSGGGANLWTWTISGGGAQIAAVTGEKVIYVPTTCTINLANIEAGNNETGSLSVNIEKATQVLSGLPTFTTISSGFTLSSAHAKNDTTLAGWTTAVAAGSLIRVSIPSAATSITSATVTLRCQ